MKDKANKAGGADSRRGFLKKTAMGAAGAALAPQVLVHAEHSKKGAHPVTGAGEHTYEWHEGWAKMPSGKGFGFTHAVQEDSQGRIIVHNTGVDSICIFDPDGKFITSFGEQWQGGAHGMQLHREGNEDFLYLAPTGMHKVFKITLTGEVVLELGAPMDSGAYENADQYVPTNIAIADNGDFYVADGYGKSWIHQYNAKGEHIRSWGGGGSEPGKMSCPHGIWIDTRSGEPEILVADRSNVRLQYFTMEGEHKRFVLRDLLHPCHFDVHGTDLLVPDLHGRVSIFNKDNDLITHLGVNPGINKVKGYPNLVHEDRHPGKFISPHGATFDKAGNIFVAEWINDGRVTKLRRVS